MTLATDRRLSKQLLNKNRYSTPDKTAKQIAAFKVWALRNPERYAANANRAQLRYRLKKFGITLEEFEFLLNAQGGRCAICGSDNSGVELNGRDGSKRRSVNGWPSSARRERHRQWHIDHDHKTGRVRGLLCHGCNLALGYVKDDVSLLRRMVSYLERMN